VPLPRIAESLDDIAEPLRGAYVERDGKYELDVDLSEFDGIKRKNEQLLGETKAERQKRREAEDRLKAIADEQERTALEKQGLKDIKAKWEKEALEPVAQERDAFRQKYLDRALTGELKAMLADLDVIDVDAAYRLLGGDYELGDEERPVLKADPTADVRKHLAAQLAGKYAFLLKGTAASGGGAGGTKRGGDLPGGAPKPSKMKTEEIRAYVEKHGREAWQQLVDAEIVENARIKPKAA